MSAPACGTWIACADGLPELGDYSVIAYWAKNGGMDMVHVEEYFAPITNGISIYGDPKTTLWYLESGVTHWTPMPTPP